MSIALDFEFLAPRKSEHALGQRCAALGAANGVIEKPAYRGVLDTFVGDLGTSRG